MKIKLIPETTLRSLKEDVLENLPLYRSGEPFVFDDEIAVGREVRRPVLDPQAESDASNVISVYEAFRDLPAGIVRDGRFWSHLAHCEFSSYVSARWPLAADEGKARDRVLSRYFADSDRHIESRNAIARLYWLGFAASRYHGDFGEAVHAIAHQQRVWSEMIERPAMVELPAVFNAVTSRLIESFKTDKALFATGLFREIQKQINLACGANFVEGMSPDRVRKMVDEIIDLQIEDRIPDAA